MKDEDKTKEQLISEIAELRRQNAELQFYKHVLDQLPVCTIIYDKSEKVIYRNNASERIDGYGTEELLGLPREEYLSHLRIKPDQETVKVKPRLFAESFDEGIFSLTETTLMTKDGNLKNVLLVGNFVANEENHLLAACGCAIDISTHYRQRELAQKKLLMAQQQLLDIIEFLPDATFVVDRDRKVIAWNRAIEEMTGVSKQDMLGQGDYAYAIPFYGKPRPISVDLLFAGEREKESMYDHVRRDKNTLYIENYVPEAFQGKGAYLWATASPLFDENGNIVGAVQSIRDITRRKQYEEALRLSEERFSKAFNASPSLMAISTFADGRYINVNDSFLSTTGYSREEVLGRTATELNIWVNPGDREEILKMLTEQIPVRSLEINFRKRSGEIGVYLLSAEILELNGKKCILSVINDITERKQLAQEMARLDRLNLVGEMAAGIGHEIRNPITTVRGFLQLLSGKKDCVKYKHYYDLIIEELDRANSIIYEYLSLAKNKAVDRKPQNLNAIVEALSPLMTADAMVSDKYIKMNLQEIPDLLLDEKEIRQLILNLVRNGLEAMSVGGSLTIKTFCDAKEVVFTVQDQGKGIEPHHLEKIGTPFFTTKDNGTGLGLAVCYSIAARHNATIKVESSKKGTTFFVRFLGVK